MKKIITDVTLTHVSLDAVAVPGQEAKVVFRMPDLTGPFERRAWQSKVSNEGSGRLLTWVMECPYAHPHWRHWLASVVSLADIEGVAPARRLYPAAEYEMMVAALQPDKPLDIDGGHWYFLMPLDLVFQFHGVSDNGARRLLNEYTRTVIERGVLSPDSDFRPRWMDWCEQQIKLIRSAEAAH